ncbi:MAG: hypothetical protein KHZ62_02120 [Clostridiales bacterium]|nr:hypothetical protein [Clostridiales bacterium]
MARTKEENSRQTSRVKEKTQGRAAKEKTKTESPKEAGQKEKDATKRGQGAKGAKRQRQEIENSGKKTVCRAGVWKEMGKVYEKFPAEKWKELLTKEGQKTEAQRDGEAFLEVEKEPKETFANAEGKREEAETPKKEQRLETKPEEFTKEEDEAPKKEQGLVAKQEEFTKEEDETPEKGFKQETLEQTKQHRASREVLEAVLQAARKREEALEKALQEAQRQREGLEKAVQEKKEELKKAQEKLCAVQAAHLIEKKGGRNGVAIFALLRPEEIQTAKDWTVTEVDLTRVQNSDPYLFYPKDKVKGTGYTVGVSPKTGAEAFRRALR